MQVLHDFKTFILWLGHGIIYPFVNVPNWHALGIVATAFYAMLLFSVGVLLLCFLTCLIMAFLYGYKARSSIFQWQEVKNVTFLPWQKDPEGHLVMHPFSYIYIIIFGVGVLFLISHTPYLIMFKLVGRILLLSFLVYVIATFFRHGEGLILPMLFVLGMSVVGYIYDFNLWLETIPAHYQIPYLKLTLNPTNYDWDFNRHIYVLMILGTGYNVCRWLVNALVWATPRQRAYRERLFARPVGWIRDTNDYYFGLSLVRRMFVSVWPDIVPSRDAAARCEQKALTSQVAHTDTPMIEMVSKTTSSVDSHMDDLRLMGFTHASARVLLSEYKAAWLKLVLHEIKAGKAVGAPKAYLLQRLDELKQHDQEVRHGKSQG